MPRRLVKLAAAIPPASYFGALLIVLGVVSNDWRGIFVGYVVVVATLLARSHFSRD